MATEVPNVHRRDAAGLERKAPPVKIIFLKSGKVWPMNHRMDGWENDRLPAGSGTKQVVRVAVNRRHAPGLARRAARFAALMALLGLAMSHGDAGYLSKIGPAPLRFGRNRAPNPAALPRLAMDNAASPDAAGITSQEQMSKNASAAPASSGAPLPPVSTWLDSFNSIEMRRLFFPATINVSTNSAPKISSSNEPAVVTPEVWAEFFKPNQTSNAVSVLAPVDFTPPQPATQGSKATYTVP